MLMLSEQFAHQYILQIFIKSFINITNKLIIFRFVLKAVSIADEDIKRQEDRVAIARKKLQDALRAVQT